MTGINLQVDKILEFYMTLIPRCNKTFGFLILAASLSGLQLKLPADDLTYSVSWIGNSYSGKDQWVQMAVDAMFVDNDGTVFTNTGWDEGGNNVEQFDPQGQFIGAAKHTHGWGYEGGAAVAANSKYIFITQRVSNEGGGLVGGSWPAKGFSWLGVSRRDRSDITKGSPFADGHGDKGDVVPGSFLAVVTIPDGAEGDIRGLWATETRLYVSCPTDNTIKVYDAETMKPLATWPVARPDRICADRSGRLWILQRPEKADGGSWQALAYDEKGAALPGALIFPPEVIPGAIVVDGKNRLMVADDGIDQQVKIYGNLDTHPTCAGTFGVKRGVWAPPIPGRCGDLRFNHVTGIGVDKNGNIDVASDGVVRGGGGAVLESYDSTGKLRWRRLGLTFVDGGAIDPGSDTDLYVKDKHFTLDYSQPPGSDWTYTGYTINPWKYPDDPRLGWSTDLWVRRIQGQKFLFVSDMTGDLMRIFRFNPKTDGEIAIPCGLVSRTHRNSAPQAKPYPPNQPAKGEWAWCDTNGNGAIDPDEYRTNNGADSLSPFVPDENGALWNLTSGGVRCLPVTGLNAQGVPEYDFAKSTTWPSPADLDQIRRVHYEPGTDTLYLGGNKGSDHNQHWKPMGPVLCAYDHWTKGGTLRWKIVLPLDIGSEALFSHEPMSFDVAGDYIFVAYTQGLAADKLVQAYVKVYRRSDGSFVGNLSSETQLGGAGLLDLIESVRAVRRSNGEYVVILEEDDKAKLILFRWKAPSLASATGSARP